MSYDFAPFSIEPNSPEGRVIEAIVDREQVTPEEAIRVALRRMAIDQPADPAAVPDKGKAKGVDPITDEELANLDRLCPALRLLDDVSDETWERIARGARQMNKEGFPHRA